MAPGIPDQLAVSNGVDVTANGLPLYYAVVKRRGDMFRSPMAFGRAVQDALDETTYARATSVTAAVTTSIQYKCSAKSTKKFFGLFEFEEIQSKIV